MKSLALAASAALLAGPLGAHPHVFVDTAMRFEVSGAGDVTGVTVTWRYDDLFTLLIFEDMGLDKDADGELTDAELEALFGFDMENWPEGFEGDLYLYSDGQKVEMPRPRPIDIAVEDGFIIATHFREIPPTPADGLEVMQYDPTYFVAYDVNQGVTFNDTSCAAEISDPDPDAATEALALELDRMAEDIFQVVELGIHFSDRIAVSCSGRSK